jgi:transketolase C-terminal domain/subunit
MKFKLILRQTHPIADVESANISTFHLSQNMFVYIRLIRYVILSVEEEEKMEVGSGQE